MNKASRALFRALQHKQKADEVRPLISAEVAKVPDDYYQLKPLFWALSYGASKEILQLLLAWHPEAASEVHPIEGWTPLHYAERLDLASLKLLIEKCPGAAAVQDSHGALPLHWAAEHCAPPAVVRLLLDAHQEAASTEDRFGRLPVRLAMEAEASQEVIEMLQAGQLGLHRTLPALPQEAPLPHAILFPGEGSQCMGVLEAVKDLPKVQGMLREANDILGYDILQVCLEGPESRLQESAYCQAALYVAGLAGLERMKGERPEEARRAHAMAGFSSGIYAALTAAGVFSFGDGLRLIKVRAEAMQEAAKATEQGLLSVAGLAEGDLKKICAKALADATKGEVCQVVTTLHIKGFFVGGTLAAVQRCKKLCEKAKAQKVQLLKAPTAFHSPLMEPARTKVKEALQGMASKISSPSCKVFLGVEPKAVDWETSPQTIIDALARQLTECERWHECVTALLEDGVEEFFGCGPAKELKAMIKRIDSEAASMFTIVAA